MAFSIPRFLAALVVALATSGGAGAQEASDADFVSVSAEALCLAALENRVVPRTWIGQRAAEHGLVPVARQDMRAAVSGVAWRHASDLYAIDHGFGACAINVDANRPGARAAMIAALSSHTPALENLTSRGIMHEDLSDLFCGDRPRGSIYAFITRSESLAGPRLVLVAGYDGQKTCADSMQSFFAAPSPP